MDKDEIRRLLVRSIRASAAAWAKLPTMLESGWLVKGSGNWYRLKDGRALEELSAIVRGFRADKTGTITHVQLSKPRKKHVEFAERNP
jgi:hypothetical protein